MRCRHHDFGSSNSPPRGEVRICQLVPHSQISKGETNMKLRTWMSMTVVCLFAALAMAVQTSAQEIITFDAPSSGTAAYQGTASAAINLFGTITGNVTDNSYGTHGFVRTPDGQFAEFDAPGADPIVGGTFPASINDFGVVTGYYIDTNGGTHGFLRTPDSQITTFDGPGTGTGA